MHRTTAGEGLLAAVKHHHNDLALGCDTNAGAGVTGRGIISAIAAGYVLPVAHEPLVARRSLPYRAVAVGIDIFADVFGIVDNSGLAILEYGKEVIVAGRTEGYTVDIGDAYRLTGRHVVEGRVYARDNIVVLADKLRVVGIAVLFVGIRDLTCQFVHTHNTVFMLFEV